MYRIITVILLLVLSVNVAAQRVSVEAYIEQFRDIAIAEMKRSGVPAAITLAQGILESENGNSELVKKSNNHFGIKCKNTWSGDTVTHDDDAAAECFRAYSNAAESYRDHSNFLKFNKRYYALFSLDPVDYAGWAKGLKNAGYATNPRYPDLLIRYIEQYNLQQYTLTALNEMPGQDIAKTGIDQKIMATVTLTESNVPLKNNAVITADPGKIISINNTKCVFVKKGTSLLAVAGKQHIDLSKLMEFNDMTDEGILNSDQYIFLQKKPTSGDTEFYTVQAGQTVYDIAQLAGIQLKNLLEYNNLNSNVVLLPNTQLFLQPGLRTGTVLPGVQKVKVHLVGPKEGLYAIAKAYHVTVQQLKQWNRLDSDNLKIGQEIIVSK